MDSEKLIEKNLVKRVRLAGGRCVKFLPFIEGGFPDRIVLMPGEKIYFVETKTTKKDLEPLQKVWKKRLVALGFKTYKIDTFKKLDKFINVIQTA